MQRKIAGKVSDYGLCSKKNYLGNAFRADWASPSTHLLYGYWVGATPDGRLAREELGYGIDNYTAKRIRDSDSESCLT